MSDSEEFKIVGKSIPRLDGVEKVTGRAQYAIDVSLPDMAFGACVRSTHAHAQIVDIDLESASKAPGVLAIVTGNHITARGWVPRYGHAIVDHPILAQEKVRFVGEPVALVICESVEQAREASKLVEVEYEPLPRAIPVEGALAVDAPIIHESTYVTGGAGFLEEEGPPRVDPNFPNILSVVEEGWGDVDSAFADSTVVVEETFRYPITYGYAMEPYNALAQFAEGTLTVWTTAQHPYAVRDELSQIFGLPLARIRVIVPYIGGGYGTKSYTKVEPLASIGSIVTGRPVKVTLTIDESLRTTRAEAAIIHGRTGFAEDGKITAREFDIIVDAGAYADSSPMVAAKMANRCSGPYHIPNLRVRSRCVYTNTIPASSLRGFGGPQGVFAGESLIDLGADSLGMDASELRRINMAARGEKFYPGMRALDSDVRSDLNLLVKELGWLESVEEPGKGVGFAVAATNPGDRFPISSALVRLYHDGTASVMVGVTEMGQGSRTVLSQIAAEELSLTLEQVTMIQSDTGIGVFHRTTGASRSTTLAGLAIQSAVQDVRNRILTMAEEIWGPDLVNSTHENGVIVQGALKDYGEVIRSWYGTANGEATGFGSTRRVGDLEELPIFYEIGVVGVEVSVNPNTFEVKIDRLVTIGDCGFAINPRLVIGQEQGAALGGLGAALFEEIIYEGGEPLNGSIVDYRIPSIVDWPNEVISMLAERRDGVGPYGLRGSGEGAVHPIGAAVASAVARAIGVRPLELPITPERLWRAKLKKDQGSSSNEA